MSSSVHMLYIRRHLVNGVALSWVYWHT